MRHKWLITAKYLQEMILREREACAAIADAVADAELDAEATSELFGNSEAARLHQFAKNYAERIASVIRARPTP